MFRWLLPVIVLLMVGCGLPTLTPTPDTTAHRVCQGYSDWTQEYKSCIARWGPSTPTPTPRPAKVECLTCEWTQEIRSLQARIERECTDTPERAANPYVCSGMQQKISLRQSNLGGTRAGVPVYTFRLEGSLLHRELTLPEVQKYIKQPLNDVQMWRRVERMILAYERTEGNR